MDLAEFLETLLVRGRIVFRGPPTGTDDPSGRAAAVLERAYAAYRLGIAGPPVPFDGAVAAAAGALVQRACWALVSRQERPEDLARALRMPLDPASASHHLSADLVLRFLPQVYRRARGIDPSDPLVMELAGVLRRWPLSGVLSDLDEGPEAPPNLGDHPGVLLLYAERLAQNDRPAWRPVGRGWDHVELVLTDLGRAIPPRPAAEGAP